MIESVRRGSSSILLVSFFGTPYSAANLRNGPSSILSLGDDCEDHMDQFGEMKVLLSEVKSRTG